jgi:hypothetical protein
MITEALKVRYSRRPLPGAPPQLFRSRWDREFESAFLRWGVCKPSVPLEKSGDRPCAGGKSSQIAGHLAAMGSNRAGDQSQTAKALRLTDHPSCLTTIGACPKRGNKCFSRISKALTGRTLYDQFELIGSGILLWDDPVDLFGRIKLLVRQRFAIKPPVGCLPTWRRAGPPDCDPLEVADLARFLVGFDGPASDLYAGRSPRRWTDGFGRSFATHNKVAPRGVNGDQAFSRGRQMKPKPATAAASNTRVGGSGTPSTSDRIASLMNGSAAEVG